LGQNFARDFERPNTETSDISKNKQNLYTVTLFSGMQHGIKPFFKFSLNDRHTFRASAEYELRLNSGNSVETRKIHGFTGLTFIRPNFVPWKNDFQLNFLKCINSRFFF
jgi:hypothetical protein